MNRIIRLGRVEDIPALIKIELAASQIFAETHMEWAVDKASAPSLLKAAITRHDLWVLEIDGQPVGFLAADRKDGDFFIAEVSVEPSYQRRGLGRLLINAVLGEARLLGGRAATLTTDRTLPWNGPYYERLGFRILEPQETPPELAAQLASEPNSENRCAMRLVL